ncbi:MAG: M6 family metalloprotease domain-containing protein [Dermatophilaceae bacterium]
MSSIDRSSWTADQLAQTCTIGPSPELKARWDKELANTGKRKRDLGAATFGLEREPRRLGFNDGVIIPPEAFPAGTSARTINAAAADRAPLRGAVRVAVVLVDFSDQEMAATTAHFNDLFFSTGVLPHGSVKEYYTEVTNGLVTLDGTVVGPYRMPHTLAWYANNGSGIGKNSTAFRSPQLALDAAKAADAAVNFGPYDNDGNGYVDAFIVVHAGRGAEETGSLGDIWSHKSTLASVYNTDGTKIYGYLTIPEDAKIGVSAHELGHLLFGFPDLYDTDYSSEGIGNWCLMAGGSWNGGGDTPSHPSAWCKANQGWASVTNVTTNGSITVQAVENSHSIYRLWKNGGSGSEYFLLENRQPVGYDSALPGNGLLIWHIDESQPGNSDENHYKVGLLQADGNRDLELNHNRGDAGDPYPGSAGKTSITQSTTPSTKSYAGADTCVSVKSIPGSGSAMTVAVTVTCKATLKDTKETHKELIKEHKELAKEIHPDKNVLKERIKEHKELTKERIKEHKELQKDTAPDKNLIKDHKEVAKEVAKEGKEGGFEGWPPGGWRPGGGGLRRDLSGSEGSVEDRLSALESVVFGVEQADAEAFGPGAEMFIDASLRPDLMGATGAATEASLQQRMADGDASAKREFDTTPG